LSLTVTPSQKGAFFAGVGLWLLMWALLFKFDELAAAAHMQRWINSARSVRWIRSHKSSSLLGTEIVNYGTHGLDPLGVSFSLGGTLVNVLMIYVLLPLKDKLQRRRNLYSTHH